MAGGSTLRNSNSAVTASQRPVVACDLDEVLGQYLATYSKWHNRVYGTHLKVSDFFTYRFWEVQGGTAKEAMEKCYVFHESPEFKAGIPLVPASGSMRVNHPSDAGLSDIDIVALLDISEWLADFSVPASPAVAATIDQSPGTPVSTDPLSVRLVDRLQGVPESSLSSKMKRVQERL
ncbi:hypothetical protein Pmar_PMAR006408 [Perkinsus marinus ATCC 50983]|uniref:Uncharacterized protein n=1 Tax=Perkinsus marinus (strain ATCC 50983 / TXsc) TaxID=423536 RepID=C5K9L6_PERM5|nr:hypothetical protein Pmar_PMAR006408 [Perkinsus marinus ATCC 50983]EER18788.1 hypothetical protein Pmar_PMAR006408 [Perkinsus marinus ATCC 50983]|eukprot:XP_002786992.1 hypothetical protein Pmar_PMAR006408 [Perkinsus marinus ATCC 50983]